MKNLFIALFIVSSAISCKTEKKNATNTIASNAKTVTVNDSKKSNSSCDDILKLYDEGIAIHKKGLIKYFNTLDEYIKKHSNVSMLDLMKNPPKEIENLSKSLEKEAQEFTTKISTPSITKQYNTCKQDEEFKKIVKSKLVTVEKEMKEKVPTQYHTMLNMMFEATYEDFK